MTRGQTIRGDLPARSIHLDFHTGPAIPAVGAGFDGDGFARTFRDAHVDSVTVFAKCHHGLLYYDTERPERHPNLVKGLDLLGEQIEALHGAGLRAPVYLSVQCDEYAADHHQDWVALTPELTQVRHPMTDAFTAGWQTLDMSSPYQDYLAEQLEEVLDRYAPVDGVFLDMCWDQPSVSRWAMAGMKAEDLDPRREADRKAYAQMVAHRYMQRFSSMIAPALRDGAAAGVWFNSRPKAGLVTESKYLRHIEVEALPTGGWGYAYLPYVGRLVRSLGLPSLSHTGRFHRSWGDMASLKPEAALRYECCQILMLGLGVAVGDLLPPSGVPSSSAYDRIGSVFGHIQACEPHVDNGVPETEVAIVVDEALGDAPGASVIGVVRLLQQLREQFDVVPLGASLESYRVVVIPDLTPIDASLAQRLEAYVARGGSLILAAAATIGSEAGRDLLRRLGMEVVGPAPSSTMFLGRPETARFDPPVRMGVRVHGESLLIDAVEDTEMVVELVAPYFDRSYDHFSGHSYTPPSQPTGHGAVLQRGRAIVLAVPLFAGVVSEGNEEYRDLMRALLRRLLPTPLLQTGGPVHLETAVVRTPTTTAVHLLSYAPSRLGRDLDLVNDPVPLLDVPVALRREAPPSRVRLEPVGRDLDVDWDGTYARTAVTVPDGHAIVVYED